MNRLAHIISQLGPADLKLIKKDVEEGNLQRLIDARIQELSTTKTCPVCGRELRKAAQKYALEFGPDGLRQKAYFDEYDCVTFFLNTTIRKEQQ